MEEWVLVQCGRMVKMHILVFVEVGCRGRVDTIDLYFLCELGGNVGGE